MEMLFPKKWLEEKAENDLGGRTNRQVQVEVCGVSLELRSFKFSNSLLGFSPPGCGHETATITWTHLPDGCRFDASRIRLQVRDHRQINTKNHDRNRGL